ncbi:hypothetical protein GGQ57_000924 [Parabacteroides faecis]|uniref:Uncharacterized protein n=1 Tax=Parabacteroides faecis TaxID=1217282 RepID=A0ABR6KHN8_9BACT|nr:hypothetical protein [Parabacteroides faecis]
MIEQMGVCCIPTRMYKQTPGDPEKEVYDGNITDKTECYR